MQQVEFNMIKQDIDHMQRDMTRTLKKVHFLIDQTDNDDDSNDSELLHELYMKSLWELIKGYKKIRYINQPILGTGTLRRVNNGVKNTYTLADKEMASWRQIEYFAPELKTNEYCWHVDEINKMEQHLNYLKHQGTTINLVDIKTRYRQGVHNLTPKKVITGKVVKRIKFNDFKTEIDHIKFKLNKIFKTINYDLTSIINNDKSPDAIFRFNQYKKAFQHLLYALKILLYVEKPIIGESVLLKSRFGKYYIKNTDKYLEEGDFIEYYTADIFTGWPKWHNGVVGYSFYDSEFYIEDYLSRHLAGLKVRYREI